MRQDFRDHLGVSHESPEEVVEMQILGLPWRLSGKESTYQ